jgi:hypothetical protein
MATESNIVKIDFLTEQQVRKLRDNVYGYLFGPPSPISDHEWEACKAKWMEPDEIRWLLDNQPHSITNELPQTTSNAS